MEGKPMKATRHNTLLGSSRNNIGRHGVLITNRKEADDVLALVRAVAPAGRTGIALSTLAPRVLMDANRVTSLLKKHVKYFVSIGDTQKYILNRFEKFHGSAEQINVDVEQSYKRSQRLVITGLILSLMGTLIAITALVYVV